MRTAIYLGAMMITRAIQPEVNAIHSMGDSIILIVFLAMDIIDFLTSKTSK